jgi:hypothetical protein
MSQPVALGGAGGTVGGGPSRWADIHRSAAPDAHQPRLCGHGAAAQQHARRRSVAARMTEHSGRAGRQPAT